MATARPLGAAAPTIVLIMPDGDGAVGDTEAGDAEAGVGAAGGGDGVEDTGDAGSRRALTCRDEVFGPANLAAGTAVPAASRLAACTTTNRFPGTSGYANIELV